MNEMEITPDQLTEQEKAELGPYHKKIGFSDATDNIKSHIEEIKAISKEKDWAISQVINFMVDTPDDAPFNDPVASILDQRGVKLYGDRNGPSTMTKKLWANEGEFQLMMEFGRNVFFNKIHSERFWQIGNHNSLSDRSMKAATQTRGDASQDSSNRPTVGELEKGIVFASDLMLPDVIGARTVIANNRYVRPVVEKPENYDGTVDITEGENIPLFKMKTADRIEQTSKAGYGTEMTYETLRTSDLYMEQWAEYNEWLAWITEQDMINEAIGLYTQNETVSATDKTITLSKKTAETYGSSGNLNSNDVMSMNVDHSIGKDRKGFSPNLVIGDKNFVLKYAGVDTTTASDNPYPLVPITRTFLNTFRGGQLVAIRTADEVPDISGNNNGNGIIADSNRTVRYIVERRSVIEERDRNIINQTIIQTNTFNYLFCLMETARLASRFIQIS